MTSTKEARRIALQIKTDEEFINKTMRDKDNIEIQIKATATNNELQKLNDQNSIAQLDIRIEDGNKELEMLQKKKEDLESELKNAQETEARKIHDLKALKAELSELSSLPIRFRNKI
jgi:chaperonin cofactor prefoldin